MANILYAWELGAGLGHVGVFMPLARTLRAAGHTLHWVVNAPGEVGDYLAGEGFAWLPAPVMAERPATQPPLSYADILLRHGYASTRTLHGLTGAWRELMRLTGARLVLADHAPSALLAARTLDLPVMLFSNGFTVPPRRNPLPTLRPWSSAPGERLAALDQAACASINAVLQHYHRAPLASTAALFDVAEDTLLSFPELDHTPERGPARYWGALPSAGNGSHVRWPDGDGARVFAYLRRESPHHEALLAALADARMRSVVYFPQADADRKARPDSEHLRFLAEPADLAQMAREADLAVTYASLASSTAFLLAGKPLLLLPFHLEQFLLARRIAAMGAGIVVSPDQPPGDLAGHLAELRDNPAYRRNAQAFAAKYAAFDQAHVLDNMHRRINALLAAPPPVPAKENPS